MPLVARCIERHARHCRDKSDEDDKDDCFPINHKYILLIHGDFLAGQLTLSVTNQHVSGITRAFRTRITVYSMASPAVATKKLLFAEGEGFEARRSSKRQSVSHVFYNG
jgi:hypothetical protein